MRRASNDAIEGVAQVPFQGLRKKPRAGANSSRSSAIIRMVSSPFAMSRAQIEESVARYLQQLDTADRQEPSEVLAAKTARLEEKIMKLKEEMQRLAALETRMLVSPDQQISLTDVDSRSMATSGRGSGVVTHVPAVEYHRLDTNALAAQQSQNISNK
jgi:hypothetical protein